ncbi:MAG: hypothetical protein V1774_05380 [Candidatus Eisenbacteria bacterium]
MKRIIAPTRVWAVILALAVTAGWIGYAAAQTGQPVPDKLKRQIDVMEKIVSQVLVDSPNLWVSGHDAVHGIYLEEYGALFMCEISTAGGLRFVGESIVLPDMPPLPELDFLKNFRVESDKGRTVIWYGDEGDEDEDEDEDADEDEDEDEYGDEEEDEDEAGDWDEADDDDDDSEREAYQEAEERLQEAEDRFREAEDRFREARGQHLETEEQRQAVAASLDEWKEQRLERQREMFEKGRAELIEALVDYGDTMTRLRDDQWVTFVVFLADSDFFREREVSRMVLKARMSDLRAYGQDRLSRDQMTARIIEEQY